MPNTTEAITSGKARMATSTGGGGAPVADLSGSLPKALWSGAAAERILRVEADSTANALRRQVGRAHAKGDDSMNRDPRDVPVSFADAKALAGYEAALTQFQSCVGDPFATLDATLAEAPDFVAGHLFKALAIFTTSEKQLVPAAQAALAEARRRLGRANDRERALAEAASRFVEGDWGAGCWQLDRVLVEHPRDAMALQVAHLMDFFLGDAQNLRNRVSRVLPHRNESVPGYSYVLGMHAFGLEEMNQYPEAEAAGRRALALQRKDGWAVHAVTHVMEMQGRIDEGIAWPETREGDWAPDNGFAFHNWWHLALFHMDAGRFDRVLALYDAAIHPQAAQFVLQLVEATALLWRLWLERIDVGACLEAVADEWQARQEQDRGFYAFNDFYAMLAFAATGRETAMKRELDGLAAAAGEKGTNGMMTREVGLPLCRGIAAFARALRPGDRLHRAGARLGASVRWEPSAARRADADADRGGATRWATELGESLPRRAARA
jgi:tetratricopeptide (TPR) repeat protein